MNLGSGYALGQFQQYKGKREQPLYAMEAIKIIASEGLPIPEELIPFLNKACDDLIVSQGLRLKMHIKEGYWSEIVVATHILVKCGIKPADAYEEIVVRYDNKLGKEYSSRTIMTKYNSSKYTKLKANVDKMYGIIKESCTPAELEEQLLAQYRIAK